MIIHCRKCGTGYRFDESLIEGEGIWVRCSRCRNVFFQAELAAGEDQGHVAGRIGGGYEAGEGWRPEWEISEESLLGLDLAEGAGEADSDDIARKMELRRGAEYEDGEEAHYGGLRGIEKNIGDEQDDEGEEYLPLRKRDKAQTKKGGLLGRGLAYFPILVTVIAVLGFAFYLLFPAESQEAIRTVSERLPIVGQWLGVESDQSQLLHAVKLTDVKQRFVHNVILGSLRVVEGAVTNAGSYPLARLRVKGEIYDSQSVILGERFAYCGNILSDEELMNSTEEDLGKKINRPEGSGFVNDRVRSGEQLPFMLIFVRENAGVAKTMVRFAGAERLK
ncbi:MAG: zinc-ribbon domain-containing protein [Smithellaceae bacterium]|nr:zinc-ribbon domain-containing protein [Smithellaceae bacterium]